MAVSFTSDCLPGNKISSLSKDFHHQKSHCLLRAVPDSLPYVSHGLSRAGTPLLILGTVDDSGDFGGKCCPQYDAGNARGGEGLVLFGHEP